MAVVTRIQKIRLAVFLLTMGFVLAGTLVYMLGRNLLQVRDTYYVLLHGGSGGLEVGSQVRFNGIVVGRVEDVALDKEDPSLVKLTISVRGGTPINADTTAVPELTGLTGSKRLALNGGTKESKRLKSGDFIPSVEDDFSLLTVRLNNISMKIETLVGNLNELTGGNNAQNIKKTLDDVKLLVDNVNRILNQNEPAIGVIMNNAASVVTEVNTSMAHVNAILQDVHRSSNQLTKRKNIQQLEKMLQTITLLAQTLQKRTGDDELGRSIEQFNELAEEMRVTVARFRSEMNNTSTELQVTLENLNEFTQILIDNPSALISGRGERTRSLP